MKKVMGLFFLCVLALVGCSQVEKKQEVVKVGLVAGEGGIEDGSFSELTWQGINEFAEEYNKQSGKTVEIQYVTPNNTSTVELVNNIDNLVMSGNQIIVAAGFAFQEAIEKASDTYKDVDFILIDGEVQSDNVASVKFTEHEAGFLAGVASALESKTGKIGYLGGVEVPAVIAYGVGFNYGVEYANEHLGTEGLITDYVYSGTFTDFNVGQMLSAGMFDKGVDIVMATAGVATQGAISEAKQREDVYIVGCDSDQYIDGIKEDGESVVLTSAMKHINVAVNDILNEWIAGKFQGGETISMSATSSGVGLPIENPNLSQDTIKKIKEIELLLKEGKIEVPYE